MGCAYVNGFPVIAESLRVGTLRTSAAKDNIFLDAEGRIIVGRMSGVWTQRGPVAQPLRQEERGQVD